jgi:ribosomal protein S12 methylthiotransferase accessory factor
MPRRAAMTEPFARFEGPATPFAEGLLASLRRQQLGTGANGRSADSSQVALAMFPLHEAAAALSCESEATGDGLLVCHVGYDSTRVVVGPIVAEGGAPCLQCSRLWAPSLDRRPGPGPAVMPMPDLVAAQLASFIASSRSDRKPDEAKILWFDLESLTQSEHRLLPHPDCERCGRSGPAIPAAIREEVPVSAETWREREKPDRARIERLVDSNFGLVRRFERETEALVHPMTFAAFVGRPDPRRLEIGVGRAGCQAEDRGIAILEAVERFSSFRPRGDIARITGRFVDLEPVAVDPRAFILPDPAQHGEPGFDLAAFDPRVPYEWGWAYSVGRRSPVLIPLQLAYYDLPRSELPIDRQFVFETSNGCALGSSVEEAALFGLFEVLERDAYLTTWYGRYVPDRVDPRSVDDLYSAAMIARIEEAGFEVSILDVGVGLPLATLAVLAIDPRGDAPVASIISTGAHLDPIQALRGALVEVGSRIKNRPAEQLGEIRARAAAMLSDGSLVMTMDDHAALYGHPDSLPRLAFLTAANASIDIREAGPADRPEAGITNLTSRLLALSDAVLAVAEDVLIVDMTNKVSSSVGLHCVKVLAPGLLPVTFGHRYRRISASRLAKVSRGRSRAENGSGLCLPHNFQ